MSNPLKDHNFAKITMKNIMKNFQKEQIRQQHHQIRMAVFLTKEFAKRLNFGHLKLISAGLSVPVAFPSDQFLSYLLL